MSEGVRVIGPDRAQLRWDIVDLDSQLPDDHRARLVWAFVEGLDLSEFYDRIKARAYAGRGSMSKRKRLERIEQAVAQRVAELKSELDTDSAEPERQRKKRALQAAEQRAQRVERARQKLAELEQEKAARAKTHP